MEFFVKSDKTKENDRDFLGKIMAHKNDAGSHNRKKNEKLHRVIHIIHKVFNR